MKREGPKAASRYPTVLAAPRFRSNPSVPPCNRAAFCEAGGIPESTLPVHVVGSMRKAGQGRRTGRLMFGVQSSGDSEFVS